MCRYCSYFLPKQGGATTQIQVNKTQSTTTWDALYKSQFKLMFSGLLERGAAQEEKPAAPLAARKPISWPRRQRRRRRRCHSGVSGQGGQFHEVHRGRYGEVEGRQIQIRLERFASEATSDLYRVGHPICRKVLKIMFWEVPPADWLIL